MEVNFSSLRRRKKKNPVLRPDRLRFWTNWEKKISCTNECRTKFLKFQEQNCFVVFSQISNYLQILVIFWIISKKKKADRLTLLERSVCLWNRVSFFCRLTDKYFFTLISNLGFFSGPRWSKFFFWSNGATKVFFFKKLPSPLDI